jgi:hypothetical protein
MNYEHNKMILVCSYSNERITELCLRQLALTKSNRSVVLVWDNHYPLNRPDFVKNICDQFGFIYMSEGENKGMYYAYNTMLNSCNDETVITMDGDNFISYFQWDKAIEKVLFDERIGTATLGSLTSDREMNERGFEPEMINGVRIKFPVSACTNTVCGWNTEFLKSIGGIKGSKEYYGGNEIEMWKHYQEKKWVYLTDYREDTELIKPLQDWQYEQYKLLYAHKGMGGSFEEYLKTNPERIENILKYIFG